MSADRLTDTLIDNLGEAAPRVRAQPSKRIVILRGLLIRALIGHV